MKVEMRAYVYWLRALDSADHELATRKVAGVPLVEAQAQVLACEAALEKSLRGLVAKIVVDALREAK